MNGFRIIDRTGFLILTIAGTSFTIGLGQACIPSTTPSVLVSRYQESVPNDRTCLLSDRDCYFTGEKVWITGWYSDDVTGEPVDRSGISYVELVGEENLPLVQRAFAHTDDLLEGSLDLPADIPSGTYYLRVHNRWQKQFGPSTAGVRLIQVINPFLPPQNLKPKDNMLVCKVFPEGSRFLSGKQNRAVVEVRRENGQYAEMEDGVVIDSSSDTIAKVRSHGRGPGAFEFTPIPGERYTLRVKHCQPLELEITDSGPWIRVSEVQDTFIINWKSGGSPGQGYLLVMHEGSLVAEKALPGNGGGAEGVENEWQLPESDLPDGILSFYLLDGQLNEQACRMVLHGGPSSSPISITTDRGEYGSRDSVRLMVETDRPDDIKHLAVSVYNDLFELHTSMHDSWFSLHWNSYLDDWDDFCQLSLLHGQRTHREVLDEYLLTKIPVRHSWQQIIARQDFMATSAAETQFRWITGKATETAGSPFANRELTAFFPGPNPFLLQSKTDSAGHFAFLQPLMYLPDRVVQFQPPPGDKVNVVLDPPYMEQYSSYRLHYFQFDSSRLDDFDRAFVNWQIQMLHREQNERQLLRILSEEPPSFYGSLAKRYNLDDYVTFPDLNEVFREIISNVRVRSGVNNPEIIVYDEITNTIIGEDPLVLLNGLPLEDISALLRIPEKEVEYIDVVARRFYIGNEPFDGLVNLVTIDPSMRLEAPSGSDRALLEGTDDILRFAHPGHKDPEPSRLPDLRNTLYWNPRAAADLKEINLLVFFTGDIPGTYTIRVQGTNKAGKVFDVRKQIRVN